MSTSPPVPATGPPAPEVPRAGPGPGEEPTPTDPTTRSMRRDGFVLVSAVLMRPDLWWTALGELRRMAPRLWWRSPPHLPIPGPRLWGFRMVTAYGRPDATPDRTDVVSFLEWCRALSATSGRRSATSGPRRGGRG